MTDPRFTSREKRWSAIGQQGATVWFTGLPAAGKSTLAAALDAWLLERGRCSMVLDGDLLREGLNADLGFSATDRSENVRRTAEVARLLAEAGTVAIVSLISPFASDRDAARALHDRFGLAFLEVFVDTPLGACRRRDPKGLYARAGRGDLTNLTGVGDPYEPPQNPDVVIHTEECTAAEGIEQVAAALAYRGVLPAGAGTTRS